MEWTTLSSAFPFTLDSLQSPSPLAIRDKAKKQRITTEILTTEFENASKQVESSAKKQAKLEDQIYNAKKEEEQKEENNYQGDAIMVIDQTRQNDIVRKNNATVVWKRKVGRGSTFFLISYLKKIHFQICWLFILCI